jgi:exosortase/archaeosortase family protein
MHKNNNSIAKDTFKFVIIFFVIILAVLPFATTFNELLTRIVEDSGFYRFIQIGFVPYISKILGGILNLLPGLDIATFPYGVIVNGIDVRVTWNCLGWQGFVLFFASLIFGLRGDFGFSSKLQTVLFGFFGTFLINMFRLVFTAALVGWSPGLFVILFHNYFMTFVSIIWLFFFWWFSYSYILESEDTSGVMKQ